MASKAVKLDETTCDRLKALGESRQRTPHWLMREAIRQFLDREEYETVDAWLATWGSESEAKCPIPSI